MLLPGLFKWSYWGSVCTQNVKIMAPADTKRPQNLFVCVCVQFLENSGLYVNVGNFELFIYTRLHTQTYIHIHTHLYVCIDTHTYMRDTMVGMWRGGQRTTYWN